VVHFVQIRFANLSLIRTEDPSRQRAIKREVGKAKKKKAKVEKHAEHVGEKVDIACAEIELANSNLRCGWL